MDEPWQTDSTNWIALGGKKKRNGVYTIRGWVLVDEADFEDVSQFNWYLGTDGYAYRNLSLKETGGVKGRKEAMHRRLLGLTDPKAECDHINRHRLDNRRSNLRVVTSSQNKQNQKKRCDAVSSKHRGVSLWNQYGYQLWRARGYKNGKEVSLGYFATEEEAVAAREAWAAENYVSPLLVV